jgi:hypothetical protein
MAKQMIQDIVAINKDNDDKEIPREVSRRKTEENIFKDREEDPEQETVRKEKTVKDEKEVKEQSSSKTPVFPPIEASPIFAKMKQRNKDRESFSDEFGADQRNGGRRLFGKITLVLGVLLVLGSFLYGIFFYDAVLTISLKHADVALQNQEFFAGETSALSATSTDVLTFQSMTLSDEDSVDLAATGEKNVSSKSSGKIVVYNNFGTQSQPLIKNTRFETPDGKIYRIHDSIVVPGQKIVNGKKVPGSLEVSVSADAAGTEYNIGLVDFTIPGFKGSPRYEKFYARSKTPMVGGASGLVKVVSDIDIQKAKETLTAELKDKLFTQALAQKPKGAILYKGAVSYSFTDYMDNSATTKSTDDKSVKLIVKGSLTATLLNAEDLSRHIVKASIVAIDVSPNDRLLVTNIEDLTFALKGTNMSPPKEDGTYAFSLDGTAYAVWQVDTVALAGKLAGVKKADYQNVFADFSGIEKASAHIRPFWKRKFPSDPTKIRVEIACDAPCQQ